MVQHAHRKGVHEVREVQTNPAEPEDAERARGQVVRVPGGDGRLPRPRTQRPLRPRKVAEGGEDEVERCGRSGFVDRAGGVGDADA